jgi:hypothetical protein
MHGLVLLVALLHCLLSCDRCRVMEGVGGEKYLEQRFASRGRALGMVEGREEVRIRSGKEGDLEEVRRFLEFGVMEEAPQVEHSQNSAAS